jgi:hypothetical protein
MISRRIAALVLMGGLSALLVAMRVSRLRDDRLRVLEARQTLGELARMQEAHRRMYGRYTDDLGRLADMTSGWYKFMASLDVVLDLRAGFKMSADADSYLIEAHARDTGRTPVALSGRQKPAPPASLTGGRLPR